MFSDACAGRGVIFMLHRVGRQHPDGLLYPPNRDLTVSPEFLAQLIRRLRGLDYDVVSIDEAVRRLGTNDKRRFAVFTLDDGYRETLETAYPVFRQAGAPFTIYIAVAWPDGGGLVRWAVLEALVRAGQAIAPHVDGLPVLLPTATRQQKIAAYEAIDSHISGLPANDQNRALAAIAERHDIDVVALCRRHILNWDEIRLLSRDELVTVGAHSVDHVTLSNAPRDELDRQLVESRETLERELNLPCRHFAYPFGDVKSAGEREFAHAASAGYATGVTTRRGVVLDHHRVRLSALPRIAISGGMEDARCIEMLISGVPDMVLNGFRRKVA